MKNDEMNGEGLKSRLETKLLSGRLLYSISKTVLKKIFRLSLLIAKALFSKIDEAICKKAVKNISRKVEVDKKTVLFFVFQQEFTCNAKAITKEMLRRKLPYNLYWAVGKKTVSKFDKSINLISVNTKEFCEILGKAKVIVQNSHNTQKVGYTKKEGQHYIQTWHGSMGIKKLEDAGGNIRFYNKMKDLERKETDLLFSNSAFETEVFEQTYWPGVPTLEIGHARNDVLLSKDEERLRKIRKKVFNYFDINDVNDKILLIAPSHNDGKAVSNFDDFPMTEIKKEFESKFGGKWKVLLRFHARNRNKRLGEHKYKNANHYPDMQDLMVAADAGITDYSSWICDFVLTGKPSFAYMPNIKEFKEDRDFYYHLDDTPFGESTTIEELISKIRNFDEEKYKGSVEKFLADRGCVENGNASSKSVDEIIKFIEKP